MMEANLLVDSKGASREKAIRIFMCFVLAFASVNSLLTWTYFSKGNAEGAFAYLAYWLPCLAGILGGAALYTKEREKIFFWMAAVTLNGGLLSNSLAELRSNALPAVVLTIAYLVVLCATFVVLYRQRPFPTGRDTDAFFSSIIVTYMFLAFVLAALLAPYFLSRLPK